MKRLRSLKVDGEERNPIRFAVPEMNLSSARATMIRHTFVATISIQDLVEQLEPAYNTWVTESRRDDAIYGDAQKDDLALAGYPSLYQLKDRPALLRLVLGGYLLQEFLGEITWDRSSPIEYWLDEVTECEAKEDFILLRGICYSNVASRQA